MKISVIIPAYNCEKILKRCVDSLIGQKYGDIEIIIVNDGSTDNTENICKSICENSHKVTFYTKNNEGPAVARQYGLKRAAGDYISFIDADDYVDENFYSILIYTMEEQNCDIVECGYCKVDEDCKYISNHNMTPSVIIGKENCVEHYAINKNTTNFLWNKLFRKKLFENIEFYPLFASEDACVLLQLFGSSKKVVIIPDVLYYYVQTANSLCRKPYNLKKNDTVKAGKIMYEYCINKFPESAVYYELYTCSVASQCYSNLKYSDIIDKKKYMEDMRNVFKEYIKKVKVFPREISIQRRMLIRIFNVSPSVASYIYKKVLKK